MLIKKLITGTLIALMLFTGSGIAAFGDTNNTALPAVTSSDVKPEYITVADVPLYKGIIKEITDRGIFVEKLELKGDTYDSLIFRLDKDTKINVGKDGLKIGQTVDIFYSGMINESLPGQTDAIAVNVISPVKKEVYTYEGTITKVTTTKFGKTLLVRGVLTRSDYKTMVFHVSSATKFTAGSMKGLKKGVRVSVEYGPVMTKSIPPQTNALTIKVIK